MIRFQSIIQHPCRRYYYSHSTDEKNRLRKLSGLSKIYNRVRNFSPLSAKKTQAGSFKKYLTSLQTRNRLGRKIHPSYEIIPHRDTFRKKETENFFSVLWFFKAGIGAQKRQRRNIQKSPKPELLEIRNPMPEFESSVPLSSDSFI